MLSYRRALQIVAIHNHADSVKHNRTKYLQQEIAGVGVGVRSGSSRGRGREQ